ncbi:LOW QUALITY PROTEIN: putative protein SEM1 [Theropithecus gelada]|uniref:LOW QUALITY PROTEIN: putative protein SEM1 n=1 Tax=Theropithecus gelada TaxID=9565 RepID=UPI000DC16C82|nr:LOW QUALITY PROTEIN: putative protein SEM1 [Theropithecus gelada]
MYCQDPNVCAVFAVQGGKVGRKHGIKRGRRPSMRNPAQQARGPWIHESKHPAFAKQQINLEMPSSGVTTERAWVCSSTSRKKNWAGSLTLPTAPLSPAPSLVQHCEDCSCLPGCHLGDLYNLAPAERTCWQHINSRDGRKQCNPSSNAHGVSLHDRATFAPMFKECSSVRLVDHLTGIPAPNGQSVKISFHQ